MRSAFEKLICVALGLFIGLYVDDVEFSVLPYIIPDVMPQDTVEPIARGFEGLQFLIVYDDKRVSELPKEQASVIFSSKVTDFANRCCAKNERGQPIYRRLSNDAVLNPLPNGQLGIFARALERPRDSLPWMIISDGKGGGYEGPLSSSVEEFIRKCEEYCPAHLVIESRRLNNLKLGMSY